MREKNRKLDNVNSEKLKKQSCSTSDKVFECKKSCTSKNIYNFLLNNCTSLENFAKYLYRPADPACLGVVRALFGKKNHPSHQYYILSFNTLLPSDEKMLIFQFFGNCQAFVWCWTLWRSEGSPTWT